MTAYGHAAMPKLFRCLKQICKQAPEHRNCCRQRLLRLAIAQRPLPPLAKLGSRSGPKDLFWARGSDTGALERLLCAFTRGGERASLVQRRASCGRRGAPLRPRGCLELPRRVRRTRRYIRLCYSHELEPLGPQRQELAPGGDQSTLTLPRPRAARSRLHLRKQQ